MKALHVEIPDEILVSLKETPKSMSRELKILAAVKLFELGKLSSGKAAQLAQMPRVEFLHILNRYQVSPFSITPERLKRDFVHA